METNICSIVGFPCQANITLKKCTLTYHLYCLCIKLQVVIIESMSNLLFLVHVAKGLVDKLHVIRFSRFRH